MRSVAAGVDFDALDFVTGNDVEHTSIRGQRAVDVNTGRRLVTGRNITAESNTRAAATIRYDPHGWNARPQCVEDGARHIRALDDNRIRARRGRRFRIGPGGATARHHAGQKQ